MKIAFFPFLFSMIWGTVFVFLTIRLKQPLMERRAYRLLTALVLFTGLRFFMVFEWPFMIERVSHAVTDRLWAAKGTLEINPTEQQAQYFVYVNQFILFSAIAYGLFRVTKSYISYIKFLRIRKIISTPMRGQKINKLLGRVKGELEIRCSVKVVQSSAYDIPCVTGFFRPTIYLNENKTYSNRELCHIFRHELTHFKYHHTWYGFIFRLMCDFLWWLPFLRKLEPILNDALEYFCDLAVTKNMEHEDKCDYSMLINRARASRTLHFLEETKWFSHALVIPHENNDATVKRIKALLEFDEKRNAISKSKAKLASFVVSLLALVTLSIASLAFSLPVYEQHWFRKLPEKGEVIEFTAENSYYISLDDGSYLLYYNDAPTAMIPPDQLETLNGIPEKPE